MTGSPRIVLATSIPPRLKRLDAGVEAGEAYQRLCVQSWEECGIRVLSANDPGEIPPLAAAFPGIEFIPTEKNAAARHGKNTPYIADLLKLLAGTGAQAVGIVNADIVLEPHSAWRDELPDAVRDAIIGVHRHDITALSGSAPRRYPRGFDLFLFQREDAARLSDLAGDFAMGVPWWDCWLAAAAAFLGRDFRALDTPRIAHLEHGTGFSLDLLHGVSKDFASFVTANVEARGECPPARDRALRFLPRIGSDDGERRANRKSLQRVGPELAQGMDGGSSRFRDAANGSAEGYPARCGFFPLRGKDRGASGSARCDSAGTAWSVGRGKPEIGTRVGSLPQ